MFIPYNFDENLEFKSVCEFEVECDEDNNKKLILINIDLDEVKGDIESLDEVNNDSDNDIKEDNKDNDYYKDDNIDDINTNNDKIGNSREIMSTYNNNTDRYYICNNSFVSTTTEILTKVYITQVIDVGVIYFEDRRNMFHIRCVTKQYGLETIEYPRCDSYVYCQSYNEHTDILNNIGINVRCNDNDNTTTVVATSGKGGNNVGHNNDVATADDDNNNDDGGNNDENNNDDDNYDVKQTYDNEVVCDICQNKFYNTSPEDLRIKSYEETLKDRITSVVSIKAVNICFITCVGGDNRPINTK